jgi:hypothetical protein
MTTDERIARLERALVSLATTLAQNYPLRGELAEVAAVKEIHAEVGQLRDADAASGRREALERELAEMGSA